MPPRPSQRNGATQAEVNQWRALRNAAEAHIGGNDPEAILAIWDDLEDSLAKLNGEILRGPGGTPEPIRKVRDAQRLGERIHPRFLSGESRYDLFDLDPDTELTDYQKAQLIGVLTALRGNPLLQNHTLNIVERGDDKNPAHMGSGVAGYQKTQVGSSWNVDQQAIQDLEQKIQDRLDELGSDTLTEPLRVSELFTPDEFAGVVGDDLRQMKQRSFVERLGELFKLNKTGRPGRKAPRPLRIEIAYRNAEHDAKSQMVDQLLYNTRTGETLIGEVTAGQIEKAMYTASEGAAFTLFHHSDSLPSEEAKKMRQKAIAISAGSTMIHELVGHGIHVAVAYNSGLRGTGETDLSPNGPAVEKLWASTIEKIVERIADMEGAEKLLVYEKLRQVMSDKEYGLSTLVQGRFGLSVTHVDFPDPDTGEPSRSELPFGLGGIHGILASPLYPRRKPGDYETGTEAQRDKIRNWMKQPVLDPDGNPYVATAGLARYFSGDDDHSGLVDAAKHEWGIDLTIAEGEPLTLGHVMYGTTPTEAGMNALDVAAVTHKKGNYSSYSRRSLADRTESTASDAATLGFRPIVRKATKTKRDPVTGRSVKLHEPIAGVNDAGADKWVTQTTTIPSTLMKLGIPALDTGAVVEGGRIKTPAVSPEDTAPLLGALAVVAHKLLESQVKLEIDDENGSLNKLVNITFDTIPDTEIGLTGQKVSDLLRERSPAEAKAFREELSRSLAGELVIAGVYGRNLTEPKVTDALDMSTAFDSMPPGDAVSQGAETLMVAVNTWDDLVETDVKTLKDLADLVGYKDYSAYSGANVGTVFVSQFLEDSRHELIAEFMVHMTTGIDFPIYEGTKRRGLTPREVKALKALYAVWMPGRPPVIRANGELYE
jgi:hypothetical protein